MDLIQKFLDYLLYEKKYSKHTVKAYQNDLETFSVFLLNDLHQKDLTAIHYNEIRSWIITLVEQKVTNRSINRKISSLKSFYKFLQKIGVVDVNPLAKHKALKVPKKVQVPFTVVEVELVLTDLSEDINDFNTIRDKLVVELFYSTGIRRIELINLKLSDVNVGDKTIKVLGKRNKERYVPILSSVKKTIDFYIKERLKIGVNSDYFFTTKKGDKLYETLVYRIINSYFSKVSSKVKKSPHILRHSFATHLLNEGADLNSVKELLGHSSLASTQVYTHNSLETLKKVYNQAHPRSDQKQ